MNWRVYSHKGSERSVNEDYAEALIRETDHILEFAVADGMGDYDCGDQASLTFVKSVLEYMDSNITHPDKQDLLIHALEAADLCLEKFNGLNNCQAGVAVAIGIVMNDVLYFTWQGNVRIYHCRESGWSQITSDHKLHIGNGVYRLSRCVKGHGIREDIPVRMLYLNKGDKLMVCTDGFYSRRGNMQNALDLIFADSDANLNNVYHHHKDDCTCLHILI